MNSVEFNKLNGVKQVLYLIRQAVKCGVKFHYRFDNLNGRISGN